MPRQRLALAIDIKHQNPANARGPMTTNITKRSFIILRPLFHYSDTPITLTLKMS